jgi:hypothetical protein
LGVGVKDQVTVQVVLRVSAGTAAK